MQLSNSVKFLATAAVAAVAFGGVTAAHARSDVSFSIGIHAPAPVYVQPAPVYVQSAPVYVEPAPVYGPPQVVYAPPPVYVQPAPVYMQPRVVYGPTFYGRGHDRRHDWERREWREHHDGRGHR